jgi:phage tail sheath protein FI
MPFQLSPGVAVVEKDFTSIVPAVATSIGAFAGMFEWGPVEEPITITSEDELVRRFGAPTDLNFQSFFTAANFLSYSNNILVVREKTATMKNAVATPTGAVDPTTVVFSTNGSGYISTDTPPLVYFDDNNNMEDGGQRPWAKAVLSGGGVTAISVASGGSGYTNAPTVVITTASGDTGSGATATAVLSGAAVTGLTINSGGSGYTSPVLTVQGGGGTGATAHATVSQGVITAVVIDNGGTGYTSSPTILVTDTTGSGANIAAAVGTSSISAITINNPGSGYKKLPTVTLTGTAQTPATPGAVTLGTSSVIGLDFTGTTVDGNGDTHNCTTGSGLSDNPTIVIEAPPSGVRAAATIGTIRTGVAIYNSQFYSAQYINGGGKFGEWAAKYPGKLGDTLLVSMADADTFDNWIFKNEFDAAPGTSESCDRVGGSNDEMHIIIIDEDGLITGTKDAILEKYAFVSKARDNKKSDGTNNFYKDVINSRSEWIWWMDHTNEVVGGYTTTNWGSYMAGTTFKSMTAPLTQSLSGGEESGASSSQYRRDAYDLFSNTTLYDVNLIMLGKADTDLANYVTQNIAEVRKDALAFISPENVQTGEVVIGDDSTACNKLVAYRNDLTSSSYAVLDSGYKYQYDRYNDMYRWVPLNGDVAGLCARTDYTNDPWWSPGGMNRGQIKNAVRLSTNPNQTNRDTLYKNAVNPVVTFPGQGTVLFGDKTLLTKPSAFDRINVRRLFIVLEKSIATAAKYQLFEFNDSFTRAQFKNLIEPFLRDVQGRRGITDFVIKCDESNNTGEVIDRNEFVADIFVKPTRSINYITLNFVATRSGINFSEVGA